ncbi:6-pyruvoyltetrahydropterin/6-carboxytetrahydropterin synthase [Myxococcaceae bacterium]|nr:6-pyruvoyltetrahydropterin/6-carboxytetrahydropterin synthase [Myxococcaceae bacterium]
MVRLTRAIEFSSSLRYFRPELPEAENARLFGPCVRTHGHNYRLEVTLRGEPDPVTGMVLDLKDLKVVLEREVEARFDHRDLVLDTPYFEKQVPTPENFALLLHRLVAAALPKGLLERTRLYQDADTFVDVVDPERS